MYNMGWFGVIRGYSRSTAMLPFDGRETGFNGHFVSISYRLHDMAHMLKFSDFQLLPPTFGAAIRMVPF